MRLSSCKSALLVACVLADLACFAADRKALKDAVAQVEANLKTPEGKKYEDEHVGKDFEKYIPAVRECKKTESGAPADFDLLVRLNADGKIAEVLSYPETPMAKCSQGVLSKGQFSPPPHGEYWVNIHLAFEH